MSEFLTVISKRESPDTGWADCLRKETLMHACARKCVASCWRNNLQKV